MSKTNVDWDVVEGFGEEWSRFTQDKMTDAECQKAFDAYFKTFPWESLPQGSRGADIGCGSGRWAKLAGPRIGTLYAVDASPAALAVTRKNCSTVANVECIQAAVHELPFSEGELDFAYSLGVLHHIPDTEEAIGQVARILKPGAPFLIYLYYRFDNRSRLFRMLWEFTDLLRRKICVLPTRWKNLVCDILAATIYWPLARLAYFAALLGIDPKGIPLSYYRDKSFYMMRTDSLDRFGTRLEHRFTRVEISGMLRRCGFTEPEFVDNEQYWCALAYRT